MSLEIKIFDVGHGSSTLMKHRKNLALLELRNLNMLIETIEA